MEKVKSMWNGLSKRGKILFGGVGIILVLIIINWFI
jgi:type II secretory pathway component PulM|tara:strand:+ start:122 stop:229 length:108 start_codon:yes stop_codon:yes gene_type:complete